MLDDQEKVALVAHELAHSVNGDFLRGFIVGSALNSLRSWSRIAGAGMKRRSFVSAIMLPLYLLSAAGFSILQRLLLYESRRAEYFADALAAEVAGSDATIGGLNKLNFSGDFPGFVSTLVEIRSEPDTLFERFRSYIATSLTNPAKMQQLDNDMRLRDSFYNWTHPPLAYRKRFLQEHHVPLAKLDLSSDEATQLKREFEAAEKQAQQHLMQRNPSKSW
jgi:heat shock protein HtpX